MHRMITTTTLLVLALALVTANSVHADSGAFYERGKEGWFWYIDPEPEPEPEEPEEKPPEPVAELPEPPEEEPEPVEPPGPKPMTVAWFREHHDTFMHRAIDNPTEDNIKAYHVVHNAMMDKVTKFADEAKTVAWQNPMFNPGARSPRGARAHQASTNAKKQMARLAFDNIAEAGGGLWFFHGDDMYSQFLADELLRLYRKHSLTMVAFSVSGNPLNEKYDSAFAKFLMDEGQASSAGVTHPPALAIAIPPDRVEVIGHGTLAVSEIEKRVIEFGPKFGYLTNRQRDRFKNVITEAPKITAEQLEKLGEPTTENVLEFFDEL